MADLQQLRLLADLLQKGMHKLSVCMVRHFPHACWTCADGRQVLVDRDYQPIWQRLPNGSIAHADPQEWVNSIVQREQLFDDSTKPYLQYDNMKRLRAILLTWGLITPLKQDRPNAWRQFKQQRNNPTSMKRGVVR